jgi:protein-disulfide isomerase
MTYGSSGDSSPEPNGRRDVAREKAKNIRELHRKEERRRRLFLRGGIVLASLAIIGVIAVVLMNSVRVPSPGPLNMQSDGILIGEDYVAKHTPAIQPGQSPVPTVRDPKSDVIAIQIYVDYFCPYCKDFELANGDQIAAWVKSGAATIEIHPLAILDRVSQGTKYSSRAANAAACVANYAPDQYFKYNSLLFENQKKENTGGLTDAELIALVTKAKTTAYPAISNCIRAQKFATWVSDAKDRALTGPIANSNVPAVTSTPTVIVNGLRYTGSPSDNVAFSAFVVQAAGANFNENSTATPTPAPAG